MIVLSAKSSGVCIISSASVIRAQIGIASASFSLILSLTTRIIKELLSIKRKKKKQDTILVLAKSKLDSIDILVSQVLIDMKFKKKNEFVTEDFNCLKDV